MNKVSEDFKKAIGADKLLDVSNLKIKFMDFSGNSVKIEVWVENKIGEFLLYPQAWHVDKWFSVGDSLSLKPNKNFKIKTRITIE